MFKPKRFAVATFATAVVWSSASFAFADDVATRIRSIPIEKGFKTDEGKPATDISGIACKPAHDGKRKCIVIDDQGRNAQELTINGRAFKAGDAITLFGSAPPASAFGTPPKNKEKDGCPDVGKFKDLDGEAVAYDAPYFYVVGSHGCSRAHGEPGKGKFRTSSFITARFRLNDTGNVQTTYRLADALKVTSGDLGKAYGAELEGTGPDGMNVEGAVAFGGMLYAGLRAPSLDGKAFLVGAPIDALFSADAAADVTPTVVPLKLGAGLGIRDLSLQPDGRMFILAGPTRDDPDSHFAVFVADMTAKKPCARRLAELKDVDAGDNRAKAEGILLLGETKKALSMLILFDGLPDGGAAEYKIPKAEGACEG